MGQYWIPVNLDKKEFVDPHMLGSGGKLCEQLGTHPATGAALVILCAAMPESRGSGDLDRDLCKPEGYSVIAAETIGRWAGDRIALVGDYAEDSDLPEQFEASSIYEKCRDGEYTDISILVCSVIEHELNGSYTGNGWRGFRYAGEDQA